MHNFSIVNLKPKSNYYQGVTQNYRNVECIGPNLYQAQLKYSFNTRIYVHNQSIFELGQMNSKKSYACLIPIGT